jgi:hypothetical protein
MDEVIYVSEYQPSDLEPIIEVLESNLQELVATRVYNEWILGLTVATLFVMVALIFAVFFANSSR